MRPVLVGAVAGGLHPGLRRRIDPEDIVQEAFVEVLRRAPRYLPNPPMPFEAWVRWIAWDKRHQVCRRHLSAAMRDVRRVVSLGSDGDPPRAPGRGAPDGVSALAGRWESPLRAVERREERRRIRGALVTLARADREILRVRLVEGASNADAARRLGLGVSAASHRFNRALRRLRRAIPSPG